MEDKVDIPVSADDKIYAKELLDIKKYYSGESVTEGRTVGEIAVETALEMDVAASNVWLLREEKQELEPDSVEEIIHTSQLESAQMTLREITDKHARTVVKESKGSGSQYQAVFLESMGIIRDARKEGVGSSTLSSELGKANSEQATEPSV